jgi:low affinity Fe/Cu permease
VKAPTKSGSGRPAAPPSDSIDRPHCRASTFDRLGRTVARWTGRPATFLSAFLMIVIWLLVGPLFDWGEGWQLFINTSTTIITFLMIFLLQGTQNRDTEAVQLKLDELIRSIERASNSMLKVEELDQEALDGLKRRYESLARSATPGEQLEANPDAATLGARDR